MEDRSRLILMNQLKGIRPDLNDNFRAKTNEELNKALKVLKEPKITEPAKLKLEKAGNLRDEGLYADIMYNYEAVAPKDLDEIQGKIKIKGTDLVILCDIEVVRFCKAILLAGRCFDEQRAQTCQETFISIMSRYKEGYITKTKAYETLMEVDYYTSEIKRACKELFNL